MSLKNTVKLANKYIFASHPTDETVYLKLLVSLFAFFLNEILTASPTKVSNVKKSSEKRKSAMVSKKCRLTR